MFVVILGQKPCFLKWAEGLEAAKVSASTELTNYRGLQLRSDPLLSIMRPAVRQNKASKDHRTTASTWNHHFRQSTKWTAAVKFRHSGRSLKVRQGTAVPTLIKWAWNSSTVVTNNRITQITHLTGFDLSLTLKGQMDHVMQPTDSAATIVSLIFFLFLKTKLLTVLQDCIKNRPHSMGSHHNSH